MGRAVGRSVAKVFFRAEAAAILGLAAVLLLTYPAARDAGFFQVMEGQLLDWRFQARGPHEPAPEVAVVTVDEKTLREIGTWPFSREWLARAVETLSVAGAHTIVFDMLLTGSDRRGLEPFWPNPALFLSGDQGARISATADQALAMAIDRHGRVVVPFAFSFEPEAAPPAAMPEAVRIAAFRLVSHGAGARSGRGMAASGALLPQAPFLSAGYPAHVSVLLEWDGQVRFAHPAIRFGDEYYPSVAVEAVRLFRGIERADMALWLGEAVRLGEGELPIDRRMGLAVNFAGPPETFPHHPLSDVVAGRVDAAEFRDRIVVIGATATGLGDRFVSPFSLRLPGVELIATMIDNILHGRPLVRGAEVVRLDLLAIVLAALLTIPLSLIARPVLILAALTLLLTGWAVLCGYAFNAHALWLNATFPMLALIGGAAIAVTGGRLRDYRRSLAAERQRETLSHYVSPLTEVGLAGQGSRAGTGRELMAVVLFVDLVGYTQTSESLGEDATAGMLRDFHELIERQAAAFAGTIDKFMGDGAMVLFGVPEPGARDAANAVAFARSLAQALEERNRTRPPASPAVACGIGIHVGPVMLVELGGQEHRQITVTGGTVNVASRLEALTRTFEATVIVSQAVVDAVHTACAGEVLSGFEALPPQQLRGRSQPVAVWAWRGADAAGPAPPLGKH